MKPNAKHAVQSSRRASKLERARSGLKRAVGAAFVGSLEAVADRVREGLQSAGLFSGDLGESAPKQRLTRVLLDDRRLALKRPPPRAVGAPSAEPSAQPAGAPGPSFAAASPPSCLPPTAAVANPAAVGAPPSAANEAPSAAEDAAQRLTAQSPADSPPADDDDTGCNEPIRTRSMARLLAGQGHHGRALSIYRVLLADNPTDGTLRQEAEALRRAIQASQ